MIKIETIEVSGWIGAIRGMRNPYMSHDKSDSIICSECPNANKEGICIDPKTGTVCQGFLMGYNDMTLCKKLIKSGPEHRKFLRMIHVQADVVAPSYWISEFATYKIGCWTPNLAITTYKQFFSTNFEGITNHYEKPVFDFALYNYINLPWGLILNIDMCYDTGGHMITKFYEPYGNIDIGLRKSFLNDALQISLWGYDVGKWYDSESNEQLGRLHIRRFADTDSRYASLTVTWKFNNFKNKYKGQSAASQEMNRL